MTTQRRPRVVTPVTATRISEASPYGLDQGEMSVLFLLREGLFVPQIAEELAIPQAEVEAHVEQLLKKMNAHSKTEAAVIAIRQGIFSGG